MVIEKNAKSDEGDLIIRVDDQIIIGPQLTKDASAAILNDKITDAKDCGKFNRCAGCKFGDL